MDLIEQGQSEVRKLVEAAVTSILHELKERYGMPIPEMDIIWFDFPFSLSPPIVQIEGTALYLSKHLLINCAYEDKLRNTIVTLELGFPNNELSQISFPYSKIIDWLHPGPRIPPWLKGLISPVLSEQQVKGEIARAIVSSVIANLTGWLAEDLSSARCLRMGIIDCYYHLLAGTVPTSVSICAWERSSDDPETLHWLEIHAGACLLYELFRDFHFEEVIHLLNQSRPQEDELLPRYVARRSEFL